MNKKTILGLLILAIVVITGCDSDADKVSHNLSKDAEQFKIRRRIVFTNLMTGEYLFLIEGNCSIEVDEAESQLEVTCKIGSGEDQYQKHFLGLSEMSSYTVEQLEWIESDPYKYKILFKPESIIPIEIDVE